MRARWYKCDAASPSTIGRLEHAAEAHVGGGESFGPKAVALLLEAFDGIVAELDLRSAADREKAAKIVMRLALGQAHLDGAKLRHDAMGLMRKEGIRCSS